MNAFLNFVTNYMLVDVVIVLMGVYGLYIMIDRAKALYFDLALDSAVFMPTLLGLLREEKIEEAIALCAKNEKKPLAYVLKRALEKINCAEHDLEHVMSTASSEVAPGLAKRLGYLSMISNVVTLVGLLGTVLGLIMAFKAVSFADVSQKQTLLADGISMAMNATALGLMVAIPVMVVYAFLHDKQSRLFGDVDRSSNQFLEFLKMRDYEEKPVSSTVSTLKMPPKPVPSSISKAS